MDNWEELEENLKKLIVKLKHVEERKQVETVIQTLDDLLQFMYIDSAFTLFEDKVIHIPVLVVLESYMDFAGVQQMGWSVLCRLMEVCPSTLDKLAVSSGVAKDWDFLGIHQQILKMLCMHNGNEMIITLGLKTLTLLLKSDAIALLVLDDETDVFQIVVDALKSFTNEEVQKYGCETLRILLEKVSDAQLVEFVESKDHAVILNALNQFQHSEDIVLNALGAVLPLASPLSNVEVLMSGSARCYKLVIDAMNKFPNNEKLQEISCCLFQKFTSENFYNMLVLNGVHDVVVKAVIKYHTNAKLQAAGLHCIAQLTETIFMNNDFYDWKDQDNLYWFLACYQALRLHSGNEDVQVAACWSLNSLLFCRNGLHEIVGDDDKQYPLHRQVMAAMLVHHSSKEVFRAAANVLATLAEQSVRIRKLLLAKGIHINIDKVMQMYASSPDVAESACKVLNRLFQGSAPKNETQTVSGIIAVMKKHESVPAVQIEALRVIACFFNCDKNQDETLMDTKDTRESTDWRVKIVKNQCLLDRGHQSILDAMNRFIGSPAIQKYGLKLLYSLVECSGCLQLLNRYGAVDTVLHTLQMYPDDKDIQYLGLTLLGALITKKSFSLTTLKLLSSVLVPALRRFHKDYRILTMGFRAVLILLESSEMAARVLQEEAFDTVLFKQMSLLLKKPHDKQFLALCCKCLAKMTADDDLKHKMLEKSCVENNTMLAECLLLLGADVNYKSKKNSFLYQVCEKGNDPLLVDLLLNNGAREQDIRDALSVSIKRGDNMIISLLLKKLGLDQTNNTISLSGLHIGKIESSWLSPLFPSNKDSSIKRQTSVAAALVRIVLKYQMKQTLMDLPVNKTDESSSEDTLDKNDDLMFFVDPSSDGVFYTGDDLDSDGSDASGNFGKRRSSSSLTEFRKDSSDIENTYTTRKSHSEHGEREPRRKRFQPVTAGLQRSSSFSRLSDSMLSMNSQKNCIRGLDLSSNDLESLDSLCHDSCIKSHLEHLQKLELHTNNLIDFPEPLCEILKCLTDLDLHSNKFTEFPVNVLEMLRISHLDISRNDIGPALNLEPNVKCPALKKLNVSFNQLLYFPDFLGDVVEKLEKLLVEGNKISEAILPLCLPELMELNLSKNFISVISEEFLKECQKLDIFCASVNLLESLPSLPSRITTLKLLSNNFTSIPEAILKLSHLRSVDMSNNEIHDLPRPSRWESSSLRELVFNCNQISVLDLSEGAYKWCRLEKLHLANNKLKEIPPQIGLLENITSLDVSHNPHLRSFPDEMGKLTKVWDLPLDGLHLDLDLKQLGSKTKDIIRFLQQRLKKSVPYYRMKLMIVGNAGSGKTTLLRQLMKCRHTDPGTENSTIGIDVKDWSVHLRDRQKRELKLNVWDFSGQEEFYSSHPHFMSRRALYLVVYDLSKGPSEVDAIKPWLFNIKARASSSPVILVGTHSDVSDEKNRKACITKITRELLNQRGFPAIRDYHFVNRTDDNDSLGKLRKKIIKECLNFKIRDQPVMGQLIPYSYLELERRILLERSNVPLEFPVTNHQRLLNIVSESQLELDENELPHAVHFLNESGVLLHFEDPALQLQDLYFVDPQWLCKLMAQILTVKEECFRKNPKGIMQRTDVVKFLSQKIKFPQNYMSQYFKLLEKFQIALPLGEEQLLIPSSLPDQRPVIELPHCENSELTIRLYEMPYFPMGFWSRLINRLLEISPYMFSGRERAVRLNRMYWRQGIYLNWSPEAYCLVESTILENKPQSFLKITVPSCRKGFVLLGKIIDHIDSLMEEWFPGLLETEIGSDETLLKKWILYSFEDGQEFEQILLEDLLRIAEEGDLMVHEENPKLTIPIAHIAPDLVLADLPRNIILNADELEMDQTPDFLLGDGGFGSVYRASYRNEEVAVKVFNKHASHRLLRQELAVLSYLHHPSLISLLAAGIRPRLLVMELAPKGSLDHFLQSGKDTLTRTLQHRIALHVADGLSYLHQSMIIYRDLKPHNVLLFTLHPNSEVIAKISDYGIAQYCCGMGIKTSEGTPGFRAPEVARGNVIYNQQADIYSFGLLLYDILTGGLRIMEGLKFPNEFDEMAVQGKLPDPVKEYRCSPWPKVQDLIMDCLKQNPQERPTAAQVYSLLNSAELLCLMQKIVVPSTLTAECIAASTLSFKKPGIWIGNGRRDQAELTFLDVGTGGHTSENVENSRILCLALVLVYGEKQEWIVAGTHSGSLIVIDAVNMASKHHLQKMTDSVTSLFYSFRSKHSRETRYLLVGTADGKLAVFEDKAVKCNDAAPLKIVNIGNRSTPLVCLSESSYSSEKDVFWGGCGTKVVSFSSDFCLHKVIDTKKSQIFPFASTNDSNILSIAVGKYIYLAKKDSHFVEVWDRKAEKPCEFIDCAAYLKDEAKKQNEEVKCELTRAARVKVLFLQESTAIWIGTGGGHILLLDLSTRRPIRVIYRLCDSIRSITAGQIDKGNPKHVVLVLGSATRRYVEDAQSYLFVWDKNLPHEIQYLKKHIEMRQEAFVKMRNYSLD